MATEWQSMTAEQFCASVRDGTHDSPKPVEHGRFLVTSRHIIGGRLDLENAYLISQEDFDAINKRSKVDKWDVLISMIGTVGEPCLIKEEPDFAIKNIGLFKSKGEVEGKWLYYYLQSPEGRQIIREEARGTTQQYIPLGALREFPILAPTDKDEMRRVVNILAALDDKVEVNLRMNKTLETIGRTIFKSWFIDFNPVRAKARVESPESICRRLGLTRELLDLFPDRLVDSELGEIPQGWEAGTIASYCYLNAVSWTERTLPAEVHYVDLANAKNGIISQVQVFSASAAPSRARRILRAGDTIMGTVRPGNRSFALIGEGTTQLTGSTGFAVLTPRRDELRELLYFLATGEENIARLTQLADGGAYPAVRPDVVISGSCVIPNVDVVDAFHDLTSAMVDQQITNRSNNTTLAAIRDLLLPKLLSGEIRVPLEGAV